MTSLTLLDLFVFNWVTVTIFVYLVGLAVSASYYEDHRPGYSKLLPLTWPLTVCKYLLRRLPLDSR